jgi:HEAT repeat protein
MAFGRVSSTMDDNEIRSLVTAFDTRDNAARDAVWQQLREFGERALPFFAELFPRAKRQEVRRDIAFHCIRYARTNEAAFRIGLAAIVDRSTLVRYRGCCILAYSLRLDAIPLLQKLLSHLDARTVADARAAIDAIENGNHHYFVDREHSGRVFWKVNIGDAG